MYEPYFGLGERPFSISPDPRYLYLSDRHREALAHLSYGITVRGGFVQLTGEVGTGKTLLTRALLEQLPADVDLALVLHPNLSPVEFLATICEELGIELPARRPTAKTVIGALNERLLESYARGRQTVVLIDEAQNLSAQVIEQVRLLTNLETHREKLLQIILVGQPELRDMLRRPELRQVAQRITARYHLEPLTLAETRDYIRHRLSVAGVERPLLTRSALLLLHRLSDGVPRLINVIADRALLGAYARGKSQVTAGTLFKAAREVRGETRRRRRWLPMAAATAAAGLLGGAVFLGAQLPGDPAAVQAAPPAPQHAEAAPPAAQPAEAAPPPATPSLAEVLNRPRLDSGMDSAFRNLFARWGADYDAADGDTPCERAAAAGLRCSYLSGNLAMLARLNLPAVIQLSDLRGRPHRVVVEGLRGDEVDLAFGAERLSFPRRELARAWPREFLVVWRSPFSDTTILRPGMRGEQVRWVVEQLDAVEGRRTPADQRQVFNSALTERIRRFQRDHYLNIDGLVGENTLLHLMGAGDAAGVPRLNSGG